MGIPPNGEFGRECLTCYAAGKTPKHRYLAISGIETGALWVPGMPGAPNGTIKISQLAAPLPACYWEFLTVEWAYWILIGADTTWCRIIGRVGQGNAFTDLEGKCKNFFVNEYIGPANKQYHGGVIQTWTV